MPPSGGLGRGSSGVFYEHHRAIQVPAQRAAGRATGSNRYEKTGRMVSRRGPPPDPTLHAGGVGEGKRGEGSMDYLTARATASSLSSGVRRLVTLAALSAVALVSPVGSATASAHAPLKVCATCTYTDIPAALAAAAAQSGDDTIRVAPGSYPEAIAVATNVTLLGAGSAQTTIGKVDVDAGVSVTIRGVTITTGSNHQTGVTNAGTLILRSSVVSDNTALEAAGIFNQGTGTLTLQDSSVTRNFAFLGSGGGIRNDGTLKVQNSTISHNGADGVGAGIFNLATLALRNSTVSDNACFSGGGAGIFNAATGTATLTNSTVNGGQVVTPGFGGGISNHGNLTLVDTTVSGNFPGHRGGGIYNGPTGTATLRDSTVSGNAVGIDFVSAPASGGGVYNEGTFVMQDSIVTRNRASGSGGGISNAGTLTLLDSLVRDNTAPIGPNIFNDGGTVTVKDTTVQP
jgi:hypothetical protein